MRHDLPTGSVTFVFTDIEGSTQLLGELGAERYGALLARHHSICRAAWVAHGGVEVETAGDAFFVVFRTAAPALRAAAEAQDALTGLGLHVRMGVHTGEVTVGETGYVGIEVHRAARIAAAAHGGQIVVSGTAAAEAGSAGLIELGEHRFKDITESVAIYQLGETSFPPLRTISNTNLPRPVSTFVGRDDELGQVLGQFGRGARLVTLTGPGGSGKTRLALEAAATLVPHYRDGVFWVGLATVCDAGLVVPSIERALGARDSLAIHVGERRLLLLLDNLEQVIDAGPQLSALLEACPNLALLVTSRERLRIRGEVEFDVLPLAEAQAVALFCQRAGLDPSDEISELCERLDNLPLAVELAAARTSALSPQQILERLARRLDLLEGGRDADPRQQTLRATIDWSYALLANEERRVFRALSVFSAGCTLDAAERVVDAGPETLQSLVEKSLLRFTSERYWMLETIRQYAADRHAEDTNAAALHARHAEFVSRLAEDARGGLRTDERGVWVERLGAELANIRDAAIWLADHGRHDAAIRLVGDLYAFWLSRGYLTEGRRLLEGLLANDDANTLEAFRAVTVLGDIGRHQRDLPLAETCAERMLRIARVRGDRLLESQSLAALATARLAETDFVTAVELLGQSLELARTVGDGDMVSRALGNLAYASLGTGDFAGAMDAARDAIATGGEADPVDLSNLATAHLGLGQVDAAASVGWEALDRSWRNHRYLHISYGVDLAAAIALARGDPSTARRLCAAADAVRETAGTPAEPVEAALAARTRAAASSAVGMLESDELELEGRRLDVEDAVSIALGLLRDVSAATSG